MNRHHGWTLAILATSLLVAPALVPSAFGRNWTDHRQIGGFQIYADFRLRDQELLLGELLQLERDVITQLQLGPAREPIHVFLFQSKRAYTDYMQRYFRGAPERRALFIKGTQPGWVFAYVNPKLGIDLRHECTHALLHSRLPMVPLWLDEGLAEYYEVSAEQRVSSSPHLKSMRWAVRFHQHLELVDLADIRDVRKMGQAEYRSAWAWVHFMLHGSPEGRKQLLGYLHDIQNGLPPGQLSERLFSTLPDIDQQFTDHVQNWK